MRFNPRIILDYIKITSYENKSKNNFAIIFITVFILTICILEMTGFSAAMSELKRESAEVYWRHISFAKEIIPNMEYFGTRLAVDTIIPIAAALFFCKTFDYLSGLHRTKKDKSL